MARIHQATLKSHRYAGDSEAGQAFLHQQDMIDAFARCIERRNELPRANAILSRGPIRGRYGTWSRVLVEWVRIKENLCMTAS